MSTNHGLALYNVGGGGRVQLYLTEGQYKTLRGNTTKPRLVAVLMEEVVIEVEVRSGQVTTSTAELGDYVLLVERQDDGAMEEVLYKYVVAPDGKRGLLRASRLTNDQRFDRDCNNVYIQSSLKKYVDDWAAKQDFSQFTTDVSLLELPRADCDAEAWAENRDYVLSLRLPEDLGWFWTKTARPFASLVWYVLADDPLYSVSTVSAYNSYGVVPALWLASDVLIGGGHGTRDNPHRIMSE